MEQKTMPADETIHSIESIELHNSDKKREYLQMQNRTDGVPPYRGHKHRKGQERARREQRDALNKFNYNFSNPNIASNHSNDFIVLRENTLQYTQTPSNMSEVEMEIENMRITQLKRSPIICPITQCSNTIGASSMLTHLLQDHRNDNVKLQEIHTGIRCAIAFCVSEITRDKNSCLGILAFSGKSKEGPFPAEREVCFRNTFLPKGAEKFECHLPVLILAHRTSFVHLLHDKINSRDMERIHDPTNEVIIIWCASPQTTVPIHCTLTACNKELTFSRSTIALVRSVLDIQNPRTFANTTPHFLLLSHGEIQKLTNNGTTGMRLEVLVTEY